MCNEFFMDIGMAIIRHGPRRWCTSRLTSALPCEGMGGEVGYHWGQADPAVGALQAVVRPPRWPGVGIIVISFCAVIGQAGGGLCTVIGVMLWSGRPAAGCVL